VFFDPAPPSPLPSKGRGGVEADFREDEENFNAIGLPPNRSVAAIAGNFAKQRGSAQSSRQGCGSAGASPSRHCLLPESQGDWGVAGMVLFSIQEEFKDFAEIVFFWCEPSQFVELFCEHGSVTGAAAGGGDDLFGEQPVSGTVP